jgi:hypothetical protein
MSGVSYKHITFVNYDSSIVNKLAASLTDDARVIIYDCHMFIAQATEVNSSIFSSSVRWS